MCKIHIFLNYNPLKVYFLHSGFYLLISFPFLALLLTGDHLFVLYICESVSVLLYSFVCFRYHISLITQSIGLL